MLTPFALLQIPNFGITIGDKEVTYKTLFQANYFRYFCVFCIYEREVQLKLILNDLSEMTLSKCVVN